MGNRASKVLLGMEYVVVAWQTGSLRSVLAICLNARVTEGQTGVELLPFAWKGLNHRKRPHHNCGNPHQAAWCAAA